MIRQPCKADELTGQVDSLGLSDIIEMLKKRYRFILAFFLACLLGAACFDYFSVPTYESETLIRISQPGRSLQSFSGAGQFADNSRRLVSTYAELSRSRGVIQRVIDKLQSRQTYEELSPKISVKPLGDSEMLSLKVVDKSPEQAKAMLTALVGVLAEGVGETFPRESLWERLQEVQSERVKAEAAFQQYARLNDGAATNDGTYRRLALEVNLADGVLDRLIKEYEAVRFYELVRPGSIRVIDPPSLPEKPLEARWKYGRILIAGILGLLSGAFLALYIECMGKTGERKSQHQY